METYKEFIANVIGCIYSDEIIKKWNIDMLDEPLNTESDIKHFLQLFSNGHLRSFDEYVAKRVFDKIVYRAYDEFGAEPEDFECDFEPYDFCIMYKYQIAYSWEELTTFFNN